MSFMVQTVRGVVAVVAGGQAHNVLPTHGNVTVNFRTIQGEVLQSREGMRGVPFLLPAQTTQRCSLALPIPHSSPSTPLMLPPGDGEAEVAAFLDEVSKPLGKHVDKLQRPGTRAPSQVTPARGPRFDLVRRAILETLADASGAGDGGPAPPLVVTPYLVSGATDSRHFQTLAAGRTFRFEPFALDHSDLPRIHGVDERIAAATFLDGIRFYTRFIQLAAGEEGTAL